VISLLFPKTEALKLVPAGTEGSVVTPILRFRVSIPVALVASVAMAAVFVLVLPAYHLQYENTMVDFSKQHYYSPNVVRRSFARQGITLHAGERFGGMTWLSNASLPFPADSLQVMVAERNGRASWGPKLQAYDERFGNVFVTYGGHDERLLERVKAAVTTLR
jgi:hypothetical protein